MTQYRDRNEIDGLPLRGVSAGVHTPASPGKWHLKRERSFWHVWITQHARWLTFCTWLQAAEYAMLDHKVTRLRS